MANKQTVYWDTCLLFALIKDEKRADPSEMPGLYSVASEIDSGKLNMVTSAMTLTELSVRPLPPDLQHRLDRFLSRSNVDVVPLAPQMGLRAGHLRGYYIDRAGAKLCANDAYHLATAITLNVSEFHTFDKVDKKDCLGLLGLSGNVAGYPLRIVKPSGAQGTLL